MEDRFRLHYQGNTVIPPSPGYKRQQKTLKLPDYYHIGKNMDYEPKVCATSRCVWCAAAFGNQFRIICPVCLNCQYCGLAATNTLSECPNCGNHMIKEIAHEKITLRPESTE